MKFLTIIIAVSILKLTGFRELIHQDRWYFSFQKRWLSPNEASENRLLLLGILLPALVIAAVLGWLQGALFGVIGLAANLLVLLYCFGRGDLPVQIANYLEKLKAGDFESARYSAIESSLLSEEADLHDIHSLNHEVLSGLIYQQFSRVFLVLFWYLALGVFGALFICFAALIQQTNDEARRPDHLVSRFLVAAEWIPVRILAFTFGLIGNFESVYQSYKKSVDEYEFGDKTMSAQRVLKNCGFAALEFQFEDNSELTAGEGEVGEKSDEKGDGELHDLNGYIRSVEQVEHTERMLVRSLVIWLAGVSVLTLTGWFS